MTIAACYINAGGVVLGADSTQTMSYPDALGRTHTRYFDRAQKLFEVGENSTLGIVTWGYGGGIDLSYRTLIAELADSGVDRPFQTVADAAMRWGQIFWTEYGKVLSSVIGRVHVLLAKSPKTNEEQIELKNLTAEYTASFCIAGYILPSRRPQAYLIQFSPDIAQVPPPQPLEEGTGHFWGMPTIMQRVTYGIDLQLLTQIIQSPNWKGSPEDLFSLVRPHYLTVPKLLPVREAIDYVHAVIYTTCKGHKFSQLSPGCGGPVEIAVITSDRRFRWVTHKRLGEALGNPLIP